MDPRPLKWTIDPPLDFLRNSGQTVGELARSSSPYVRVDLWERTIELTFAEIARHQDRANAGVEDLHEVPADLPAHELADAIASALDTIEQLSHGDEWELTTPTDEPNPTLLEELAFDFESLGAD